LTGFDALSDAQQRSLRESLPLQPGRPLDRQLAVATRDRALNVLKDEGYPYASVAMMSQDVGPKRQRIVLAATAGTLAHIGAIDVRGEKSVGKNVIERQLTFKTGDRYTRKELRESQRKLYGLELFEFANIESLETLSPAWVAIFTAVLRRSTATISNARSLSSCSFASLHSLIGDRSVMLGVALRNKIRSMRASACASSSIDSFLLYSARRK